MSGLNATTSMGLSQTHPGVGPWATQGHSEEFRLHVVQFVHVSSGEKWRQLRITQHPAIKRRDRTLHGVTAPETVKQRVAVALPTC